MSDGRGVSGRVRQIGARWPILGERATNSSHEIFGEKLRWISRYLYVG